MMRTIVMCGAVWGVMWIMSDAKGQDSGNASALDWQASGTQGAVAAGGSEAAAAGLRILKNGGNAVDAAVATILALSITDSDQFCFGGEVPIMVYSAERGVVEVLSGQGVAPRLATRDYFANKGSIPGEGVEPAAVPAVLDACTTALERYGTMNFASVVAPSLEVLDRGDQPWHGDLAKSLRQLVAAEGRIEDRRRGLRLVADCFYRGPIARELDRWSRANGGLLRYSDLATHVTRIEEPLYVDYRDHRVFKCGPWTQGPYLLQTLRLLEQNDLAAMGQGSADTIHAIVEAMKLALADRDVYYADPLFEEVPIAALLSERYMQLRRPLIDMSNASIVLRPGDPVAGEALLRSANVRIGADAAEQDTTTCLTADRWGNVVAATPSGWGGVIAGKTGIQLGTRLQSFNIWEGHPNCIEPGKRPRITLTPTLVFKSGKPVLAISVAGGDGQDQVTLQMLINAIDFDMPADELVTVPRFDTSHLVGSFRQTTPKLGSLQLYEAYPAAVIDDLKARGHRVELTSPPLHEPIALTIDPETGRMHAAGDPEANRHAAAY